MEKVDCNLCGFDTYRILHHESWELRLPEPMKVVKCVKCGLVYMNPRMDEKERRAFYYSKQYYEASNYEEAITSYRRYDFEKTIKLIEYVPKPRKLLDIGCATGKF